ESANIRTVTILQKTGLASATVDGAWVPGVGLLGLGLALIWPRQRERAPARKTIKSTVFIMAPARARSIGKLCLTDAAGTTLLRTVTAVLAILTCLARGGADACSTVDSNHGCTKTEGTQ